MLIPLATFTLFFLCSTLDKTMLQLDLTLTQDYSLQTAFKVNNSLIKFHLDIDSDSLIICCQQTSTLLKIYSYLTNIFFCLQSNYAQAQLPIIGRFNLSFIQNAQCPSSTLGLSPNSIFLHEINTQSLSPFRIQDKDETSFITPSLKVGIFSEDSYTFYRSNPNKWSLSTNHIQYADFTLPNQTIFLTSSSESITMPNAIFQTFINYLQKRYSCRVKQHNLYCPCETGINANYPNFTFVLQKEVSLTITPDKYLEENGEVCRGRIIGGESWKINIMLFHGVNFHFQNQRVGIALQKETFTRPGPLKLPIQLILNCLVILLMCVFISMLFIELIKRLSGLETANNTSFQAHMLNHQQ